MNDYLESISSTYNIQSSDMSTTLSALLILAFLVYVVIDTVKKK